jgi:hypothetical protein
MQDNETLEAALAGLRTLQEYQEVVEETAWVGPDEPSLKRRHVSFHLTIAAGKVARAEERHDHGEDVGSVLEEVAPDLLIYAMQLASIRGHDLGSLYLQRVRSMVRGEISHRAP